MPNHSKRLTFALLNALGTAGVLIMNTLAVTLPLNGKNTGELSDQYPNLFVPVGLTFAIWSVIFLLLIIFSVYGLVYVFRNKNMTEASFLDRIGWAYFGSCLANMSWIFAWHYEIVWLSVLIMLVILGSLLAIYQRQRIGLSPASRTEKYLVNLPISIYLGWISIATIANVTAFLVDSGYDQFGLGAVTWTILLILIGLGLAMAMTFRRNDIFYALVVAWAFFGIYLKRSADADPIQSLVLLTSISVGLILTATVVQIFRKKVY